MGAFPFWMSIVGYPFLLIIIGAIARFYKGSPLPCSTDLLGLLAGVDIFALQTPKSLEKFTVIVGDKSDLSSVNLVLIVLDLVFWTICLMEIEPKVANWYNGRRKRAFPFGSFVLAWGAFVVLFVAHMAVFTGRVSI